MRGHGILESVCIWANVDLCDKILLSCLASDLFRKFQKNSRQKVTAIPASNHSFL